MTTYNNIDGFQINRELTSIINQRRQELGLNYSRLSEMTGFGRSTISDIFSNKRVNENPGRHSQRFNTLVEIARCLNIEVSMKINDLHLVINEVNKEELMREMSQVVMARSKGRKGHKHGTFLSQVRYMLNLGNEPDKKYGFLGILSIYLMYKGEFQITIDDTQPFTNRNLHKDIDVGPVDKVFKEYNGALFNPIPNSVFNIATFS